MKQAVVLDKSFLQGASKSVIQQLAGSHRLVMTGALFYELLTCDARGRRGCFIKLPKTESPVELVDHISTLITVEINRHKPAGKPTLYKEDIRYYFNSHLLEEDYILPLEAEEAINEQLDILQTDIKRFITQARLTPEYFPDLFVGSDEKRVNSRHDAEQAIVASGGLLPLYASLESPDPHTPFPPSSLLDESWAIYRWLQVQILFGLDLFVRYQGQIPEEFTETQWTKLEHDVLDAQVLIVASLEGAFATREKKLIRWWNLLCPHGELFQ